MVRGVVREELGVPVEVDALEEAQKGWVVDPEDAIVVLHGPGLIICQGLAQLRRPSLAVVHRVRALPSHLRPWVLELHQLQAQDVTHLQQCIRVGLDEAELLLFLSLQLGQLASRHSQQAIAIP